MDSTDIILIEKKVALKDPEALYDLAEVYRCGRYWKEVGFYSQDIKKALQLTCEAASLGCKRAISFVEAEFEKPIKVLQKEDEYFYKLKSNCSQNIPEALFEMGLLLQESKVFLSFELVKSQEESNNLINKSANLGYSKAIEYCIDIEYEEVKQERAWRKRSFQNESDKTILETIIEYEREVKTKKNFPVELFIEEPVMACMSLFPVGNKVIEERFKKEDVKLIGFLFSRDSLEKNKSLITKNLNYFNERTHNHIDIYCAGYTEVKNETEGGILIKDQYWSYSDGNFNEHRKIMESNTKWRFSGEIDLVLTNVIYDKNTDVISVDYSQAMVCHLSDLIEIKAFSSIESFFEKLCQYSEYADSNNPIWKLSDKFGLESGKSALIKFVLSLIPKSFSKDLVTISKFSVNDISRKST
ncbi:MAG: glycerophosphoryl diester phosphodiesterase [Psychroserpens sp.]|jgi:glycerophosphoryl diester phosphodiesterase